MSSPLLLSFVLLVQARSAEEEWKPLLERRLLAPGEAASAMMRFVDRAIEPLPLPESGEAWRARRDGLRREVLDVLGIEDLVPPRWELNVQGKGTVRREGYRIERVTFESYPGMAVPGLLYVPEGLPATGLGLPVAPGKVCGLSIFSRRPASVTRSTPTPPSRWRR